MLRDAFYTPHGLGTINQLLIAEDLRGLKPVTVQVRPRSWPANASIETRFLSATPTPKETRYLDDESNAVLLVELEMST
jgi:hypothetical protein